VQAPSLGATLSGTGVWQEAEAAPGSAGCRATWCRAGAGIGERGRCCELMSAWLSDHLDAWSLVLFPVTYSIMTVIVFSV
jgi:hypothetical protein